MAETLVITLQHFLSRRLKQNSETTGTKRENHWDKFKYPIQLKYMPWFQRSTRLG